MSGNLFGELLGRFVSLSDHDVAEILETQSSSHRRFGEIAISWGLCEPKHVWRAWCRQLSDQNQKVNLSQIGIDTQSIIHLPKHLASIFRAIPIRSFGDELVVAICEENLGDAVAQLPGLLGKKVKFVLADSWEIDLALKSYYPPIA